ncbi:hypothetical protein KFE25_001640 [Diacronema lutheri]|uniref:Kinesin motor domain-containing protein n=1 Tax=Diacronema lutheri TaxID=2081491 RepID=A0A8J5XFG0_DIALT|nr:hypothetical protein KFE25_001640 [Diacronema lutheri]
MEIASAAARRRLKRAEDRVAGRDGATSAIANDDLATLRAMFPSVYPGVVAMIYADVAGQQIERAIESLLAITDDSHAGGGADGDGDIDADATPDTTVPADAVDTAALQHDLAELRAVKEKLESDADDGTLREQVALATQELALARQMLVAAEERAEAYAKKYVTEFFLRKELHNQLQDLVGNLRVFCRIRPPRFEFNRVYGPSSTQEDVFRDTEPLMTSVLDGFNVCVLAYGQSGSGKTFTMEGTVDEPGLTLRAVERLFELAAERRAQGYESNLTLGMIEIYNEGLRDLIAQEGGAAAKLEIQKDATLGMYVHGGETVVVDSAARSDVAGDTAKESIGINQSLTALGTVIAALANGEKHVPYRNSKLTFLLQDSLGGNSKTLMCTPAARAVVTVSPAQSHVKESISSLTFATRARSVALGKASKNREAAQAANQRALATIDSGAPAAGAVTADEDAGHGGTARGSLPPPSPAKAKAKTGAAVGVASKKGAGRRGLAVRCVQRAWP